MSLFSANYSLCGFQGPHLVGSSGLEPPTSRLSGVRSNLLSYEPIPYSPALPSPSRVGGDERIRTDDPLLAKQVLYQLSYTPSVCRPSSFALSILFRARSKLYSAFSLASSQFLSDSPILRRDRADPFLCTP